MVLLEQQLQQQVGNSLNPNSQATAQILLSEILSHRALQVVLTGAQTPGEPAHPWMDFCTSQPAGQRQPSGQGWLWVGTVPWGLLTGMLAVSGIATCWEWGTHSPGFKGPQVCCLVHWLDGDHVCIWDTTWPSKEIVLSCLHTHTFFLLSKRFDSLVN